MKMSPSRLKERVSTAIICRPTIQRVFPTVHDKFRFRFWTNRKPQSIPFVNNVFIQMKIDVLVSCLKNKFSRLDRNINNATTVDTYSLKTGMNQLRWNIAILATKVASCYCRTLSTLSCYTLQLYFFVIIPNEGMIILPRFPTLIFHLFLYGINLRASESFSSYEFELRQKRLKRTANNWLIIINASQREKATQFESGLDEQTEIAKCKAIPVAGWHCTEKL